ncbi:hypothetical protein P3X46_022473 [Hevea brasiliensis]|uniref:PGG domain-containing protein n=2 Tax=Hevea brasiliensis TaxID=3981 RepID=A0ABQ9LBE9_HEVBR|nr:hypothetical protein P3X46_022473 [Hevea brasiliensis]
MEHTYIDADLQKAAAEGKLDPFKDYQHPLDSLLTPNKNTILHIHLTYLSERSTEFVKQVLGICPSLLLKFNVHGDTPLHFAARYGHAGAAEALIEQAKASPEIDIESGEEPRAREANGIKAVRKMLRMTNENKDTALHEAARYQRSLNVVKAIMRYEDPDEFAYSANDCGETPLYLAVENGRIEIVLELLRNPNSQSLVYGGPNGKTALHAAAMYDFSKLEAEKKEEHMLLKMIGELLDKWSSLTKETDEKGWTPLHYAAYKGHTSVVEQLLDKDQSSAYVVDKDWKRTALHIAAGRGFQETMETIISKCPDCCELIDIKGWNVLHYAVISKNNQVLQALLRHSSLIYLLNQKDSRGNTPAHLYEIYLPRLPSFIRKGDIDILLFWWKVHDQIEGYSSSEKDEHLRWMKELGTGPLGEIEIQDEKVEMRNKNMIDKFEKAKDSHLVAAALIATVTFAAAFTLPGGYISNEDDLKKGTPILSRNSAFKAFMIFNTIAMVLSTCSVFIHFMLVILGYLKANYWLIKCAISFLFYAIVAMVITFVTGAYAILAPSLRISICVIGLTFFIFLFYAIIKVVRSFIYSDDYNDVDEASFYDQKNIL